MSGLKQFPTLLAGGPANRLNTLDAEWFDDGLDRHEWLFSQAVLALTQGSDLFDSSQ
jgi:hypothetical protein